ncbi:MAG TPA: ABC transporter permease, partial [Vicinamibacterales bacterium]|nr:ABC transporter permease [Vicinamibacterales bacterium]
SELLADLRYGLRRLRRSPGYAAAAVLSLTLAIGANTAIFSVLDQLVLRPLPVERPEELLIVASVKGDDRGYLFSDKDLEAFRRSQALSEVFATASVRVAVETDAQGSIETLARGLMASGNYYTALGVRPAAGRLLHPADDEEGRAEAVAVLSHAYWHRQFGGDPALVGRRIRLNGRPFTVVGVSADGFRGTDVGSPPDVIVPAGMRQPLMPEVSFTDFVLPYLRLMARLAPGVSAEQAASDLNRLLELQAVQGGGTKKGAGAGAVRVLLEPGAHGMSELRSRFSQPLVVLMGVVGLVLLIACANVANLSLARAETRRREFAVRLALGARPARLARQLLTESLVIAALGGAGGLALAWVGTSLLAGWVLPGEADALAHTPDLRVFGFTALITMAAGVGFGLVPAWTASRVDAINAQRSTANDASRADWRPQLGRLIVVSQVAVSLVLLVIATQFVRTLANLEQTDLGFVADDALAMRLEPPGSGQKWLNADRLDRFYRDVLDRVRGLAGVERASLSGETPVSAEDLLQAPIQVPEYVPEPDEYVAVRFLSVYPDYFRTLGVPLLFGRDFGSDDGNPSASRVAVINETMAEQYFGTIDAVGREFTERWQHATFEVVGVVADVRDRSLREAPLATAYLPFLQTPSKWGQMTLVVRLDGNQPGLAAGIRGEVRALEANMAPPSVERLTDRIAAATRQERLVALVSGLFGLLGATLACVGLYGVVSYGASRRTAEFGVRMALGADARDVQRLVLADSLAVVAAGALVGLGGAAAAAAALASMFFGLAPLDPVSFAAGTAGLAALSLIAAWLPARRSARLDPLTALRRE